MLNKKDKLRINSSKSLKLSKTRQHKDIGLLFCGDSIVDGLYGYSSALVGKLGQLGVRAANILDGAQGGSKLSDFWSSSAKGARYVLLLDPIVDKTVVTDIIIGFGPNDALDYETGAITDLNDWEDDYAEFVDFLFTDFSNLQNVYLLGMTRHRFSDEHQYWQPFRQSIAAVPAKVTNGNCVLLPEIYHFELEDNVHPSASSYLKIAELTSYRIAYENSTYYKAGIGPTLESAITDDSGILLTFNMNDGSQLVINDLLSDFLIRVYTSLDTTISYSADDISIIGTNQVYINTRSPWLDEVSVECPYGTLYDMDNTDLEVIKDNKNFALSYFNSPVTVSDLVSSDPILALTNLKGYFDIETMGYTVIDTENNVVNNCKSINGQQLISSTGREMYIDTNAFPSGKPGLRGYSSNSDIRFTDNINIDMSSGALFGCVVDFQDTGEGTKDLLAIGNNTSGYTNDRFYTDNNNRMVFARDIYGGFPAIWNPFGNVWAIICNAKSDGSMDVYINNDTVAATIAYRTADFAVGTTLWLNGRGQVSGASSLNNKYALPFIKEGEHDAINDPSIATLMNRLLTYANG